MDDERSPARRLDDVARAHGIALDPFDGMGKRARSGRRVGIAMQGAHLPSAPHEGAGDFPSNGSGDADDQGCSGRALHALSPVMSMRHRRRLEQ